VTDEKPRRVPARLARNPESEASTPSQHRRDPRLAEEKAAAFIEHLARSGSVSVAAERAGVGRTQMYERRRTHKRFAKAWTEALGLGVERLHDDAITRALEGDERSIVRKGEIIGTERRIDNRLVQFLLKVHKPEFAGGTPKASESELETMARKLKAAARRLDAHRARQAAKKKGGGT
jgi:hypothetical protein